ncbi:hypothetical protein NL50_17150 [Clostridium acetobutylicum]|nr:hypothetical protein NL50_17150 [Clostridium acetobutylicum]
MFGRKYNYFVVYKYRIGEDTDMGNAIISANWRIKSDEDIRWLEKQLEKKCDSDWCMLINFILL